MDGVGAGERERLSRCGVISFIARNKKFKTHLCGRVDKKNKPSGGTIGSLFKRPLTLHTLV